MSITRVILTFSVLASTSFFACATLNAQQALIGGERIISVGPILSNSPQSPTRNLEVVPLPAPIVGQSVLQVDNSSQPAGTAQSDAPIVSKAKDWDAELRKAKAEHQHDMNQASQRIEHLSKLLEGWQQRAEQLTIAEEKLKDLQAKLDAAAKQEKSHVEAISDAQQRFAKLSAEQKEIIELLKQRDAEIKKQSETMEKFEGRQAALVAQLEVKANEVASLQKANAIMIEQREADGLNRKELEEEVAGLKDKLKQFEAKRKKKPNQKPRENDKPTQKQQQKKNQQQKESSKPDQKPNTTKL